MSCGSSRATMSVWPCTTMGIQRSRAACSGVNKRTARALAALNRWAIGDRNTKFEPQVDRERIDIDQPKLHHDRTKATAISLLPTQWHVPDSPALTVHRGRAFRQASGCCSKSYHVALQARKTARQQSGPNRALQAAASRQNCKGRADEPPWLVLCTARLSCSLSCFNHYLPDYPDPGETPDPQHVLWCLSRRR